MSRITLNNFEELISANQIEKGLSYFESGAVVKLEQVSKDDWQAYVEGTEVYTVTISLKGNSIMESDCNCPYEEEFCKHIVATLFAIKEERAATDIHNGNHKRRPWGITDLLKKVKNEDLRKFVEEYSVKNKEFRTLFLLRFADRLKESGKKKYDTLVANIVKMAEDRQGMFDYPAIQRMSRQLNSLLDEAGQQVSRHNYLDPFNLGQTIIKEVYPVFFNADDSDNSLYEVMHRTFSLLDSIQDSDAGYELKEELFEFALQEAAKPAYRNFGLEGDWYQLLRDGALDETKQEKVLSIIDQCLLEVRNDKSEISSEFSVEKLLRRKMEMLERMGRKQEARNVMESNLRIRSFRTQVIEEAIATKDFASAKELLRSSKLSDQEKGRLYASSEWDELLLKIALEEQDVNGIRHLAFQLYKDRFDLKYYRIIKATYSDHEWPDQAEKISDSIRNDRQFSLTGIKALAEIRREEKDWPGLLKLMEKNASLHFIEDYYSVMKDRYSEELVNIYKEALRRYAEHNMGTNHYKYVADTLWKIQSLPTGNEAAKALAIEFKVKYRQRRNMVKELNKLVF